MTILYLQFSITSNKVFVKQSEMTNDIYVLIKELTLSQGHVVLIAYFATKSPRGYPASRNCE